MSQGPYNYTTSVSSFTVQVTPQRLKKLYENTRLDGLTDEFVQLMSAGQVTGRLTPEEVRFFAF